VGNLIELTTFRRNETTMEVTMLNSKDEDIEDDEGGLVTAMCQVGGQVECKKTITMTIMALNLTPSAQTVKNPPNVMTLPCSTKMFLSPFRRTPLCRVCSVLLPRGTSCLFIINR
jgi:hypothetical protein